MSRDVRVTDGVNLLEQAVRDTIALHERALANSDPVLEAARAIVSSLQRGGKLLLFGNGGSASDAQHVAAEFVGRFLLERRALAAVALTTDTSVLTAVGNDTGYDEVFARQIEALGASGDVAMGITTSGQSANVLRGLEAARRQGLTTIALTGRDGGPIGQHADVHVNVASESTPRVQEVQRTLLHVICDIVERALAAS
jgi:D-sedoheptulose 7-phosphate isomerase